MIATGRTTRRNWKNAALTSFHAFERGQGG